ncbi:hypothetical protein [Sinisalibacter lacisalsi]|uniref:Uncharacterized protein n=1 Tax=Sinisalibacter lacisalsi TaxID=1526570 RepID=A0ABQ1QBL6_9RHOB|nr:hypothetical protein [Sinisalibacter lacisalsi]GGD21999.1 hypothetical protein GCM10011358_03100 [Sinisalibacter lacisalsi]
MKIVELKTGLFPDANRVAEAVTEIETAHDVERHDVSGLAPEDTQAWADVAEAVLSADMVVTL